MSHTIINEQLIFMYSTSHLPVVRLAAVTLTVHVTPTSIIFSWFLTIYSVIIVL